MDQCCVGKNNDNSDCLVKFMSPVGPSTSFHWPQKDDNGKHTESNTTTNNRDKTSVHHPRNDTGEHNQTVPGKVKKEMVTG
jgi:hypothetical protein